MERLTIGGAFSRTFAFVAQNWLSIILWMGGALALIIALGMMMIGNAFTAMGASPGNLGSFIGLFARMALFGLAATVVLYAAGLMIWRGGLVPGSTAGDVGWALGAGALYALAYFVLLIVLYIALVIVMVVLGLIFAALGGGAAFTPAAFQSGAVGVGALIAIGIAYIGFIVAIMWFQARLSVAGPVMAAGRLVNPVTGIAESWRLTGPSQWRIVGFSLVIAIVTAIAAFVVAWLVEKVAGQGVAALIITAALVYLPALIVWIAIPPAIYREIVPGAYDAETFA
jgi:hypothetical protein